MILIAYASKSGTTKECAGRLQALLPDAVLCDLTRETPDPARFDTVLVGGSVRMGALHRAAAGYLKAYEQELQKKRLGVFICCCFVDKEDELLKAAVPQSLLSHAACACSFGGRMDPGRQRSLDKLICKMAAKSGASAAADILPERIERFAAAFRPEA
ncbi:MAG: flavodoxin domain-containing protein [Hominenteromicrobium sp.]